MALKIQWSKKASKRFDEIINYLEKEFGDEVSSKFIQKVYEFLDLLEKFPELGSLEYKALNIRGFVIVKQTTIFYQVKNDEIIVLNFFDNRQNPKNRKY